MKPILWSIFIPIILFCILNLIFFLYAKAYRYSTDRLNTILTNYYIQNVKARPDGIEYGLFRVSDSQIININNVQSLKGSLYVENMATHEISGRHDLIYPVEMFPQI
jgi:hypothetical protein